MKRKRLRWIGLGGALLLIAPGLPTAAAGGFWGILGYPRYLPAILWIKLDLLLDPGSATTCTRRPDRCMDRIGTDEFHRVFVGKAFTLVRSQRETLVFQNRSYYEFSPPMAHLSYYFIDGYLCSSRGHGIFPGLSCQALIERGSRYYLYDGRTGRRPTYTELRYRFPASAL